MTQPASDFASQWLNAPILPVVVINTVDEGLAIAEGLIEGGINQIEITLRTPVALEAIRAIAKAFPSMALSAGTVLSPTQFDQAHDAGATLFISPGLTETLAEYANTKGFAWVPGVATASEVMRAMELGYQTVKFFPAMAAGGPKALAGITAPLAKVGVIPTGGVTLDNLPEWRKIPAVKACGGTWLTSGLPSGHSKADDIAAMVATRSREAIDACTKLAQ